MRKAYCTQKDAREFNDGIIKKGLQ
jgi:hypothetical protein